jgi:hypothetical protein
MVLPLAISIVVKSEEQQEHIQNISAKLNCLYCSESLSYLKNVFLPVSVSLSLLMKHTYFILGHDFRCYTNLGFKKPLPST